MEIISIELVIHYDVDDNDVILSNETSESVAAKLSLVDIEQEKHTGLTSIELNSFKGVKKAIKHFNKVFNKIQKYK